MTPLLEDARHLQVPFSELCGKEGCPVKGCKQGWQGFWDACPITYINAIGRQIPPNACPAAAEMYERLAKLSLGEALYLRGNVCTPYVWLGSKVIGGTPCYSITGSDGHLLPANPAGFAVTLERLWQKLVMVNNLELNLQAKSLGAMPEELPGYEDEYGAEELSGD